MVGHMTGSACSSCGWDSTAGASGVEPPFLRRQRVTASTWNCRPTTPSAPAGTSYIKRPSMLMPLSTPGRRLNHRCLVCARRALPCHRSRTNRSVAVRMIRVVLRRPRHKPRRVTIGSAVDDEHDGTYEILDLGPARDKRRKEAEADLPTPNSEAEPA